MNSAPKGRYAIGPEQKALLARLLEQEGLAQSEITRIPRRDERSTAPLSYAQQRLWFLDRLVPGNPFYNVDAVVPIRAAVDAPLLESTINRIVSRHEALRTVIQEHNGEPVQRVAPALHVPLTVTDLRALPPAEREAHTRRLANEEAQRPFDLATGPLIRTHLVTRTADDHVLLLTMHHVVSDGWSLGVFSREMSEIYVALASGREPQLQALTVQYGDFAAWQREWLAGPRLDEQLGYWRKQLSRLTPLRLPSDKRRPATPTFRGGFHHVVVPARTTSRLKAVGQSENATLFMVTLAAFAVLLCRYSRQEDVAIGSPIANRNHPDVEPLIGFFVNTLVLRADLSGNPTFRELLRRVRQMAVDAYAHQDLPFERLVEELQPDRDLSRNPLFQVIFQLFAASGAAPAPDSQGQLEFQRGTSKFDLRFDLWETADGLRGQLEYSSDLFEEATIARMANHYLVLLQSVSEAPDTAIHALPLVTRAERRQLASWNPAPPPLPAMPVHAIVEEQARRTPRAAAVEYGDVSWTYAELNQRADGIAVELQRRGVGADTPVAVFLDRSADMVAAFLGVLKAGGAYVPLDLAYPPERLRFMLEDAAAPVVIACRQTHERLPATDARVVLVDDVHVGTGATPQRLSVGLDNLAYIIYTSGSTGQPKGVCVTHRGVASLLNARDYVELRASDVVAQGSNASFDAATFEIWGALAHGAKLVGLSKDVVLTPARLRDAIREARISVLFLTTVLFNKVAAEIPDAFAPLRCLLFGGESCDPRWVLAVLDAGGPGVLLHMYGPTETTTYATWHRVDAVDETTPQIPIGRPLANTTVHVLDAYMQQVPPGAVGEIFIGGDGVARGYWQRPQLTRERFVADPFGPTHRFLYRTGDLGRRRLDGALEFYGRTDHQVKVRGFRVELGEIEDALVAHPAVRECAVIAVKGSLGDLRLVAYVTVDRRHLDERDSAATAAQRGALVDQWRHTFDSVVYDGIDTGAVQSADPTFNIVGWNSSYTGLPIALDEMRQQVDRTVERILALAPQRVLEIGCGTGLLLLRVAPAVERYVGTDFSSVALRFLQREIDRDAPRYDHVKLVERTADDFSEFEAGAFDTVVLNSIVQYLPSIDDLQRIIAGAVALVSDTGTVFVGDVRSYPLLQCLHTSIELSRAPASLSAAELRERIDRQVGQDQELTVDPAFFARMKELCPRITSVQVQQKRGTADNELTRYRYDVVLQVAGDGDAPAAVEWHDWSRERWTLARVVQELEVVRPAQLALRGVPNARLAADGAAVEALREGGVETVAELRARQEAGEDSVHPEDFWSLGDVLPYDVVVRWSPGAPHRLSDVRLVRRSENRGGRRVHHFPAGSPTYPDLARHANDPVQARFMRGLVPELQRHLQRTLPDYMCPSTFVLVPTLPLSPNGKVDRSALAGGEIAQRHIERPYVAPVNAIEERLAAIWSAVLGLELVGVNDNFFTELGGHSLLATQVVSRVRDVLHVELPLRWMFETPTIAGIADRLAAATATAQTGREDGGPITPAPRTDPDIAALSDDEVDELLAQLQSRRGAQS
jgi:amino acid adenylation domain-containing protein